MFVVVYDFNIKLGRILVTFTLLHQIVSTHLHTNQNTVRYFSILEAVIY